MTAASGLSVSRNPPDRGIEAARLRPLGTACAMIDWPLPPDAAETAIMPQQATALCRALLATGRLAFRWDDAAPPGDGSTFFPEPSRTLLDSLRSQVLPRDRDATFGVLLTADAAMAPLLFDWGGWSFGCQAVLVHDPVAEPEPIVRALGRGLDWRGRSLPPGCRMLFGSGHDGGFAMVAAASAAILDDFIARIGG